MTAAEARECLMCYERIPVSNLRALNASRLRSLRHALVIERHAEPLAVIVPYDWYCSVVGALEARRKLVELEGA